jgi:hypothetical protein
MSLRPARHAAALAASFRVCLVCAATATACNSLTGISDFATAPDTPGGADATTDSHEASEPPVDGGEDARRDASAATDAGDAPDTPPLPRRVFVTNAATKGGFGGFAGANAFCNNAATEADAGGGGFIAWLSNASVDTLGRLPDTGPWVQFDRSATVFPSKAHIANGMPPLQAIQTEKGGGAGVAWTGSLNDGTKGGAYCGANWGSASAGETGLVGTPGQPMRWSNNPDYQPQPCDNGYSLICFEK